MSFFISNALADTVAPVATTAAASQSGGFMQILMLVGFVVIFYLLTWMAQRKRAKEQRDLVNSLATGDEVITNAGIYGKITQVADDYVVLSVANGVELKMQKMAITNVLPKGSLK